MVYNNGFGVKIITNQDQDKLTRGSYNYVALDNNTEYKIQLRNDRSTDSMAEVYIEGDRVGTWLIPSKEHITIDRPANIARKFTFFKETDPKAIDAGVVPGEFSNGVVRVIFYPKKQYIAISPRKYTSIQAPQQTRPIPTYPFQMPVKSPPVSYQRNALPSTTNITAIPTYRAVSPQVSRSKGYESGATVLGGKSSQSFGSAERFPDNEIDWDNKTEITIRLIVKPDDNLYISTAQSSSNNMWNRQFVAIKNASSSIPPRINNYGQ